MTEPALDIRPALPPAADVEKLRERAATALAALGSDQMREFVARYVAHGNARRAAEEAGYAHPEDFSRRLRAKPEVAEAIRAVASLRGAESSHTPEDLRALLSAALDFDPECLYVRNSEGHPVGLRELSSLSAAERLRVKSLNVRMRRSAQGNRASFINLEVDLVNPLEIIDRIAKLAGYYASDGPTINLATLGTSIVATTKALDGGALWAEVLDALLSDEELAAYFATEDEHDRRAILRPAVARLRALPERASE